MFNIIMQLHGGSKSSGPAIKSNAPGAVASATIDNATSEQRQKYREQLMNQKGRNYTNKTGGASLTDSVKKSILGE